MRGRSSCLFLALLVGGLLGHPRIAAAAPGAVPTPGAESAPGAPESRLARQIEGELEAGQVSAAQADADLAARRFPASALLRRRLAQVHLSLALQQDAQLQQALDDARLGHNLSRGVSWLQNDGNLLTGRSDAQREEFSRFLLYIAGPVVTQFQEHGLKALEASGPLLQQRSQALTDALADLKEARRLGDSGTELELTDLWGQVVALLWRQQPEKLKGLGKIRLAGMEQALAPFAAIQPDGVLRAAAALAKQRPTDPAALAGAADLISVVAGISRKPDLLIAHLNRVLDRSYLQNAAATDPQLTAAARETHRRLYEQMRDAKDPDVVAAPTTVALQLYSQAWRHDPSYTLPYLRLRLYLLQVAFDRSAARPLLNEIQRHEPDNMVVLLEQARAALLLDGQPLAALGYLAMAARLPSFSRSYLVAVPAPLRPALKFQRELREWIGKGWPGYGWYGSTLTQMQHAREAPYLPRAQVQLYEQLSRQFDLRGLELRLAERLCQAPDYADQASGIGSVDGILSDMLRLAQKQNLPPAQQDALRRQLEAPRRAYADFPRTRFALQLTFAGLRTRSSPSLEAPDNDTKGPLLWVFDPGNSIFSFRD